MKWALVNSVNVVENLPYFDYDPTVKPTILETDPPEVVAAKMRSSYTPPEGLALRQVEDWVDIGDDADAPNPNG